MKNHLGPRSFSNDDANLNAPTQLYLHNIAFECLFLVRTIRHGRTSRLWIFEIAARSRAELSLEGAVERVWAGEADRRGDCAQRLLPLREPAASFIQTEILHKVARRFPKNTLEYFAEMAWTHACSTS